MNTKIAHLQHSVKEGYLWRKWYDKNTIELAKVTARCAMLTIRFLQLHPKRVYQ